MVQKIKLSLTFLTALLLAPLAVLHEGRNLPGFPGIGKLRAGSFQPVENRSVMAFTDWNRSIK